MYTVFLDPNMSKLNFFFVPFHGGSYGTRTMNHKQKGFTSSSFIFLAPNLSDTGNNILDGLHALTTEQLLCDVAVQVLLLSRG